MLFTYAHTARTTVTSTAAQRCSPLGNVAQQPTTHHIMDEQAQGMAGTCAHTAAAHWTKKEPRNSWAAARPGTTGTPTSTPATHIPYEHRFYGSQYQAESNRPRCGASHTHTDCTHVSSLWPLLLLVDIACHYSMPSLLAVWSNHTSIASMNLKRAWFMYLNSERIRILSCGARCT